MMGRQTGDQSQLFYLFNLEERVPASCIIPTIHHGGSRPMVNKSRLRLVTPANILPTVTPRRGPNTEYRTREHLTEAEVEALIKAAKANRWPHRDATMILLAFRHGLRVGELVNLKWEQVDLDGAVLHVNRLKSGTPSTQPMTGRELRALRRLRREAKAASPFVFVSERGAPFTADGFAKMLARAGEVAGLEVKVHPHMLRHACGFALANKGTDTRTVQAYLGHRSITNTVRYTALSPGRFKGLWRD
jgi:integrase